MNTKGILVLSTFLILLFVIQSRSSTVKFIHIGCFLDKPNRTMPQLLGNWRSDNTQAIQKCAKAAEQAGYSAFGLQYAGECWSGPRAHMTFSTYGTSNKCVKGLGGTWAQDVYMFVNAAQIANYDIKRCYEVDFTVHYNIPGGLTLSLDDIRKRINPLLTIVTGLLPSLPACSGVRVTKGELKISLPGDSSAFIKQTVIFTASGNVPNSNVASKLAGCISLARSYGKPNLDRNLPSLSQGGTTYRAYNQSTMVNRSCCGGDIPPPCCAAGSIKVSSTKCGCVPGFRFVPGSLCARCPNGTYQAAQGQTSCDQCPGNTSTFGKTGATSASNCTDNNPLQIRDMPTSYLPFNPPVGTVVVNVTVTGDLALLVQPFIFYIETVTQLRQSRNTKKRRRRDMAGVGDVCEDAGTIPPSNYFCINRRGGQIKITRAFVFNEGDEFELIIRVEDGDRWGKTENTFKLKFISRDECKDVRKAYEQAVKFCPLVESLRSISCPPMKCLQALYTWKETLSRAIGSVNVDCSFDPDNMTAVAQRYSSCIGPPAVTLNPEPLKVIKGAPAVLTCNASSPLNITITWFKDGKPMQRFGNELVIDKVEFKDQGDYYCKFSTELASTFSKPALLSLQGVLTSIVAFRIVNENYETDLLDPSSTRYNTLQIDIERSVENHLNSESSPWTYEVKLSKFRDLSAKVGVILVVYSEAKTEDFTRYYNNLKRILVDGDLNTIFSSLTVSSKSVTIRSATHCLAEKTGKESVMGEFEWNSTRIGENLSSIMCPHGPPGARAARLCGGNFSNGGVWKIPDDRSCKYKSERTNKLRDLTETPVDVKNVVQVTKEVKSLTSSPDEMNEADAALIADVIEDIVSVDGSLNETGQDVLDVIDNVMQMKRADLQESQRSNKASSKLVQALNKVATSLPLLDQQSSRRLIAPSVAIQTNRVDPGSFSGMSLAVKTSTADLNKLTPESLVSDELPPEDVQTSITLPEVLFENNTPSGKAVKVGFVIYQNDKFFQGPETDEEESSTVTPPVTSKVISSSVEGYKVENLSQPLELLFEPAINMDESSGTPACVFWDFKALGGLGNWSDRGCKYVKSEAGRVKCHCDHMTSFAVLFSAGGPKKHDEEHALALSIISYVGCAISLVGLTITLATYALFRNLRKTNQQPILMSLCVSLMLLLIVFIAGAGRTENLIGCRIVAVLLHYFALSSVMWMGVEGYNMYMSFVKVMATYQSKFMLKASTVAWGLPAVIVVITLSAATSYYGNNNFCVLYGIPFQAAMFAPVLLIILVNFVIFILAIRSLNRTGALVSAEKKSTSYHRARTSVAILLLLGLTWVFGALAVSRVQLAFDYLFCIFNSLQGFLIFYFHCVRHQEVRNQWKWLLLGKGTRYHPSSSESHTGYPKTNSKANKNNISNNTPMRKSLEVPRKQTFSTNDGDNSPTLQPRPDVVPAEV